MEPVGRYAVGVAEVIAAILILISGTAWLGATLTLGIVGGAIMMHLTNLGIDINEDGGLLFGQAILTFVLGGIILWMNRKRIPIIGKKFETTSV